MRAILVTPVLALVKVFVQASIYLYNLHMLRPMIFKLGIDLLLSKLVMPTQFGVSSLKVKVIVTYKETVEASVYPYNQYTPRPIS